MHAKYGQSYDWIHKEYYGHSISDTYIETQHTDICIIHHHFEKEWYKNASASAPRESCLHTITIATGMVDDSAKVVRLRPETIIHLERSLPHQKTHKHEILKQLGYEIVTDDLIDTNTTLILECMHNAKMSEKMINNVMHQLE